MRNAFLFPGQGSQAPGMGQEFRRAFHSVRERFAQASERMSLDLCAVIDAGSETALAQTHLAQPAIFVLSYSIFELLAARGVSAGSMAGHSLGEFTAVTAAGSLSFSAALDLVIERGRLMHEVNRAHDGGMLAVSGASIDTIETLVARVNGEIESPGVWIANYNAPTQVVLSGLRPALRAMQQALAAGGCRGTWLNVAGPYHSPLMADAARQLATCIDAAAVTSPQGAIVGNSDTRVASDGEAVRAELSRQMLSAVQWVGCLERIRTLRYDVLVEVGPGRTLKGLALRQRPPMDCLTTGTLRDFDETCRRLEAKACASL